MACSSMDSNNRYQIRSRSLPSKFNCINQKIEEKLKKLRTKEELSTSASETISTGLSGLAELYTCINEVLNQPLTQQGLSLRQHDKCAGELLKECSRLLNVSSTTREIMLQHREAAERLESSLSKGEESSILDGCIACYNLSRKELIRRAKEVNMSLKQLNGDSCFFEEEDYHLSEVTKALRCVSIINISVYESLLFYLSMPVSKPRRSLVSKLMNKGRGEIEDQAKSGNELNNVDVSLHILFSRETVNDAKSQTAQERLNALVGVMEGIENDLESVGKQLKETKACLMDIVSF